MAFISNQWLRGDRQRDRKHWPVRVAIRTSQGTDEFDRDNDIALVIVATEAASDKYNLLRLSRAEVEELVDVTVKTCSVETQRRIAAEVLAGLDDAQLVALLSEVFRARTDNPSRSD